MCYKYYNMNYTYLLVGASCGGISYYTYRNPHILMPYVIKVVRYYHVLADYLTYGIDKETKIQRKRKHSSIDLICYNTIEKIEEIRRDIKEVTDTDDEYDLKMIEKHIDNKTYYKRLYEKDLNNLIVDNHFFFGFLNERPFLQVEYEDTSGKKIDIHLELKPFYIDRNRILDKKFLIWFMNKYYAYDITEKEYTLNIMNNNINMFKITSTDYVVLRNDTDIKYEIIKNQVI